MQPLTVKAAREILEHPQFGNPEHIEAVRLLEYLSEALELNCGSKNFECHACGGSGTCDHECCECGEHDCGACSGSGKSINSIEHATITELSEAVRTLRDEQHRPAA